MKDFHYSVSETASSTKVIIVFWQNSQFDWRIDTSLVIQNMLPNIKLKKIIRFRILITFSSTIEHILSCNFSFSSIKVKRPLQFLVTKWSTIIAGCNTQFWVQLSNHLHNHISHNIYHCLKFHLKANMNSSVIKSSAWIDV